MLQSSTTVLLCQKRPAESYYQAKRGSSLRFMMIRSEMIQRASYIVRSPVVESADALDQ
jgi:hypothetical protein